MRGAALALLALGAVGCGRTPAFVDYEDFASLTEDPIVDGCDKVDYLFVIDNSASMGDYQRRLAANFPTFIEGVERSQETLASVHVGVLTTDNYTGNAEGCRGLGDLVTKTGGYNSSNAACGPFAAGNRFMTEEDDLAESFACTAKVGTQGALRESPLTAIGTALSEHKLRPGACNEGFIRDDALLVIVIVTDEDEPDASDIAYEKAVAIKNGHDDNVVVVALVLKPGTTCDYHGHSTPAYRVSEFANSFEHSFIGSICDEDYGPTFESAVEVVHRACG